MVAVVSCLCVWHDRHFENSGFRHSSTQISMNFSATARLPSIADAVEHQVSGAPISLSAATLGPTDEALLLDASQGSRDALSLLFKRYARTVRGVAYRVLRDVAEADDLVQDVFILIHQCADTFDSSKGSARLWIMQVTYRRAISRRRYLASRNFYKSVDIEDVADQLADIRNEIGQFDYSLIGCCARGKLEIAFGLLSERQRQTLRLFFVEGYTFEEIAAKLGQSRGNVKHHYFRGLERLRKELFGDQLPGERAI